MEIEAAAAARFIERPDARFVAVLFYGSDAGLVKERADRLTTAVAGNAADPFRVAVLPAERLLEDAALLADEAAAYSMTGGRRVVRVRDATNDIAEVMEALLSGPPPPALVVVEAGALAKKSALPRLFLGARNAAAVACYHDEGEPLARFIEAELRRSQLKVAPDALLYLADNLGGDRALTRAELDKLATYMARAPERLVHLEDAAAAVGDSAAFDLDDLVLALADGDLPALESSFERQRQSGTAPISLLRAAARHFHRLHLAAARMAAGAEPKRVMETLRPPVFYKHRERFSRQARRWPQAAVGQALERLLAAELDCKQKEAPQATIAGAALMAITRQAPRRGAGGEQA